MTKIAQIPSPNTPQFDQKVKQWIELRDGVSGLSGLKTFFPDRFVTVADLYDPTFINDLSKFQYPITKVHSDYGYSGDSDAPNPPTNLQTSSEVFRNILTWSDPTSENFWYIEVYLAKVASGAAAPDASDAVKIATVPKGVESFVDTKISSTLYDHYYWIRAVSYAGVASVWDDGYIAGVTTINSTIDNIMDILKGVDPDAWSSQGYTENDRVLHGGKRYKCILTHGSGQEPPNTTYWEQSGILITGNVGGVNTVGIDGNLVVDSSIYAAAINTDNAFIGMTIQSAVFTVGSVGWQINKNGDAEFNSGIYRGTLGADIVQANNIVAGTITATQIAANTITASQIAANTITASQILGTNFGTLTITSGKIAINTTDALEIQASGNIKVLQGGNINMHSSAGNNSYLRFYGHTGVLVGQIHAEALDKLGFLPALANQWLSIGSNSDSSRWGTVWIEGKTLYHYARYDSDDYSRIRQTSGNNTSLLELNVNRQGTNRSIYFTGAALYPSHNNTTDLGDATHYWKDFYANKIIIKNSISVLSQLQSTIAGATGVIQEVYHNSASPANGDIIEAIKYYGNNSTPVKTQIWESRVRIDDITNGTEDSSIHWYGIAAGVTNLAYYFNGDGNAYADEAWNTFSPDILKHPDYKNKKIIVPEDYLNWALEDAKKPIKPYKGIPEDKSELKKYSKDIGKIAIGIAIWAEDVDRKIKELEQKIN